MLKGMTMFTHCHRALSALCVNNTLGQSLIKQNVLEQVIFQLN